MTLTYLFTSDRESLHIIPAFSLFFALCLLAFLCCEILEISKDASSFLGKHRTGSRNCSCPLIYQRLHSWKLRMFPHLFWKSTRLCLGLRCRNLLSFSHHILVCRKGRERGNWEDNQVDILENDELPFAYINFWSKRKKSQQRWWALFQI